MVKPISISTEMAEEVVYYLLNNILIDSCSLVAIRTSAMISEVSRYFYLSWELVQISYSISIWAKKKNTRTGRSVVKTENPLLSKCIQHLTQIIMEGVC